ncbi:MAG: hypothetical protein JWP25_7988 [Bradyrhizobium sp.]|jgi:hypothetical protein|nr:hypothetical protein [Bradyrhizobium sp.]
MGHRARAGADMTDIGMGTPVAIMMIRMKPLPRRHRIAHLRALIRQQPVRSVRREELAAWLRDEMTMPPGKESRAL